MEHLALTRGDGIVVGVENVLSDSDEDVHGVDKHDPLANVPVVQTVVKCVPGVALGARPASVLAQWTDG